MVKKHTDVAATNDTLFRTVNELKVKLEEVETKLNSYEKKGMGIVASHTKKNRNDSDDLSMKLGKQESNLKAIQRSRPRYPLSRSGSKANLETRNLEFSELALNIVKQDSGIKKDSSKSQTRRSVNRLLNLYSEESELASSKDSNIIRKLMFHKFLKTSPLESLQTGGSQTQGYKNLLMLSDALLLSPHKRSANQNEKANTISDLRAGKNLG